MNTTQISRLIGEIESRLALIKKEMGATDVLPKFKVKKVLAKKAAPKGRGGPTEPLKKLLAEHFFDKSKLTSEVVVALKKKALTFPAPDVSTQMRRMVVQGLLEREGDGTNQSPWRYKKA